MDTVRSQRVAGLAADSAEYEFPQRFCEKKRALQLTSHPGWSPVCITPTRFGNSLESDVHQSSSVQRFRASPAVKFRRGAYVRQPRACERRNVKKARAGGLTSPVQTQSRHRRSAVIVRAGWNTDRNGGVTSDSAAG